MSAVSYDIADSEQRRPRLGPATAARARAVASEVPAVVDADGSRRTFRTCEVYLRTAVGVDAGNWAKFGFVKMPEYRWGILLAPQEPDRKIGFGAAQGRTGVAGGSRRIPQRCCAASS